MPVLVFVMQSQYAEALLFYLSKERETVMRKNFNIISQNTYSTEQQSINKCFSFDGENYGYDHEHTGIILDNSTGLMHLIC